MQELVVRVEGDLRWCPVESILMEAFVWSEGKMWTSEARCEHCVEACCLRFGRLDNEIDIAPIGLDEEDILPCGQRFKTALIDEFLFLVGMPLMIYPRSLYIILTHPQSKIKGQTANNTAAKLVYIVGFSKFDFGPVPNNLIINPCRRYPIMLWG